MKIVAWSEEDQCYVGTCPELMFGGVHGSDQQTVLKALCTAIEDWIEAAERDGDRLPAGMAGKQFSGKFNIRMGTHLHQRLAIEAATQGKSLNTFCTETLQNALNEK